MLASRLCTLFCLTFLISSSLAAETKAMQTEETSLNASWNLLASTSDKGLVLIRIPEANSPNGSLSIQSVRSDFSFSYSSKPLGVFKGHLVTQIGRQVGAINLKTGVVRRLTTGAVVNARFSSGHLHFVVPASDESKGQTHKLMHLDLNTLKTTETCDLNLLRSVSDSNYDFSLTVSPNGTRVAIAEIEKKNPNRTRGRSPNFRMVVADTAQDKVSKSEFNFAPNIAMTGMFELRRPPQASWSGESSIVVACWNDTGNAFNEGVKLHQVHVDKQGLITGLLKSEPILKLPKLSLDITGQWLFQSGSEVGIHSNRDGRYLIDTKQKKLVEHDSVSANYKVIKSSKASSLKHIDKTLDDNTSVDRVFVSQDGTRVAWLPASHSDPRTGVLLPRRSVDLRVHDSIRGTRKIFSGDFFGSITSSPTCIWIPDHDLVRSPAFDKLPDLFAEIMKARKKQNLAKSDATSKRPSKEPSPRRRARPTRVPIENSVAVRVITDKKTYLRNEPVHAVFEIENLHDKVIQFDTKKLQNNGHRLVVSFSVGRQRIPWPIYDFYKHLPKSDLLEIPPGKTVKLKRTYEVEQLGVQDLQLKCKNSEIWQGQLTCKTTIEVVKETTPELIQEKFDRLMAKCLWQYEQSADRGGNMVNASCFWQMGEVATPILIDYLRNCKDGKLRTSLGKGLISGSFKLVEPYYKELLKSDLQHEAKTLRDGLWRFANHRKYFGDEVCDKARGMMFEAAKHSNANVRKMVLKRLSGTFENDITEMMRNALGDGDPEIPMIAARHLELRSEKSLQTWFTDAKENPTLQNFLAAKSFSAELKRTWEVNFGNFPQDFRKLSEPDSLKHYATILDNWIAWCEDNPRISNSFFEVERAKAKDEAGW